MKDTLLPQKVVSMYCFNNKLKMERDKLVKKMYQNLEKKISLELELQDLQQKKSSIQKDLDKIEKLKSELTKLL